MALKLTPSGKDLLLRTMAGEAHINFTAIQFGNGSNAGASAAELSNPLLTAEITSYEVGDIFVTLTAVFSNSEVTAGFRATELGVLADDPDSKGGTLLYAYEYTSEAKSDYIPASTDKVLETQQDVLVYIGDAENVTASISQSLIYAGKAEFEAFAARRDNPHKVTAKQVGLDKVPNVATNDQTPTWTMAGTLTALASGEKLSVALGKLAKAVSSLMAHLGNTDNPHKVTADKVGAAAASHKHSTTDITAGTLGVGRGGTGVTGYAALREKLGLGKSTDILDVAHGGTGVSSHDDLLEQLGLNGVADAAENTYRKEENLSAATKKLYGAENDAVPDNIFESIFYAMYGSDKTIYKWMRTKTEYTVARSELHAYADVFAGTSANGARIGIAYADSYEKNADGTFTLVNPTVVEATYDDPSYYASAISGKYFVTGAAASQVITTKALFVYLASSSFALDSKHDDDYYVRIKNYYTLTLTSETMSEIVTSTNSSTYPVENDGWTYISLGSTPAFPGFARIETGVYMGTGAYGAGNDTIIKLSGVAKLLVIYGENAHLIACPAIGRSFVLRHSNDYLTPPSVSVQESDRTVVTIRHNSSALFQMNSSNSEYQYVAIY